MPTQPSALLQFLRVEPDEARPLLLLWIHSLFVGIAIVLLYVAANTLFLAHLPAQALPYAYVVSALLCSACWRGCSIVKHGDG
ncbi:MAG: hypothetical protein CME24_19625 [Gemmatimonadetes bacterium]|nr:hypothetical protein [Gemmatimonadota bacterium]